MYRNILIASDGSELSHKAQEQGLSLAKAVRAKVTAVTVTVPLAAYTTSDIDLSIDPSVFEERMAEMAKRRLGAIAEAAKRAGIRCLTIRVQNAAIYKGIVETAQEQGCDLIVMAPHGRQGLSNLILGSETSKVLTHSTIPVLIVH